MIICEIGFDTAENEPCKICPLGTRQENVHPPVGDVDALIEKGECAGDPRERFIYFSECK